MATGTVKWFNDDKGYGFITPDDQSKDLFVYHSRIAASDFKSLARRRSLKACGLGRCRAGREEALHDLARPCGRSSPAELTGASYARHALIARRSHSFSPRAIQPERGEEVARCGSQRAPGAT